MTLRDWGIIGERMREDAEGAEGADNFSSSASEIEAVGARITLAEAFRGSMRNLAASVSVVTVGTGNEASGFTATSVISLSVDPPTVLVSVNLTSASLLLVEKSGKFAVNILSSSHLDIAETFAGRRNLRGSERYIDPNWQYEPGHIPHLTDALAVIECEVEETLRRYTHAILIGRVTNVTNGNSARPLIYWQGSYRRLFDDTVQT